MIAYHLWQRLRLNETQERAALAHVLFIGLFVAIERIGLAVLSTPSRVSRANELPTYIYVIPITSRALIAVAVWWLILWVLFVYWPVAEKRKD